MTTKVQRTELGIRIFMVLFSVMAVPAMAWAFNNIQQNTERIVRLESQQESMMELMREVRKDVKVLLEKVK